MQAEQLMKAGNKSSCSHPYQIVWLLVLQVPIYAFNAHLVTEARPFRAAVNPAVLLFWQFRVQKFRGLVAIATMQATHITL